MNAILADLIPWSRRKWLWFILGLFAGHILLFQWLAVSREASAETKPRNTHVRFSAHPSGNEAQQEIRALKDPTLFALANVRGFSGKAWLEIPPFRYQITNRLVSPDWLDWNESASTSDWIHSVRVSKEDLAKTEKLAPTVAQLQTRHRVSPVRTILKVIGDFKLVSTNRLPAPDSDMVPSECVIRITVNPLGETISAIPLSSSGYPKIDQNAMTFARNARFAPPRSGDGVSTARFPPPVGTIAELVFQWAPAEARGRDPASEIPPPP